MAHRSILSQLFRQSAGYVFTIKSKSSSIPLLFSNLVQKYKQEKSDLIKSLPCQWTSDPPRTTVLSGSNSFVGFFLADWHLTMFQFSNFQFKLVPSSFSLSIFSEIESSSMTVRFFLSSELLKELYSR